MRALRRLWVIVPRHSPVIVDLPLFATLLAGMLTAVRRFCPNRINDDTPPGPLAVTRFASGQI
jgi:hypothetical protein